MVDAAAAAAAAARRMINNEELAAVNGGKEKLMQVEEDKYGVVEAGKVSWSEWSSDSEEEESQASSSPSSTISSATTLTCRVNNAPRKKKKKKVKQSFFKEHVAQDCCRDQLDYVSDESTTSDARSRPRITLNENCMDIKVEDGTDMIKFELSFSSTLVDFQGEVTKRFKYLQAHTFEAKYQDEANDWIILASDQDLHKCMSNMRSLGRPSLYLLIHKTS